MASRKLLLRVFEDCYEIHVLRYTGSTQELSFFQSDFHVLACNMLMSYGGIFFGSRPFNCINFLSSLTKFPSH